jgi:hypothetical protein
LSETLASTEPTETEVRAAELTRRGGTSVLAALGWSVLFVVLLIGTLVLEELVLGTEP